MKIKLEDKEENISIVAEDESEFRDEIVNKYDLGMWDIYCFYDTPLDEFLENCKENKRKFKIELDYEDDEDDNE